MSHIEEDFRDRVRQSVTNIIGDTMGAGIRRGAATAAQGLSDSTGKLYDTFVKRSTKPTGRSGDRNAQRNTGRSHKFGGGSSSTPPNAAGSKYSRETFGTGKPRGKTSMNGKDFDKMNRDAFKDVKNNVYDNNTKFGLIIKPNYAAVGASTAEEINVLQTVWTELNRLKNRDFKRGVAEMIQYLFSMGAEHDPRSDWSESDGWNMLQQFYESHATRPIGYGFGAVNLFEIKEFESKVRYLDVADVAKSTIIWILNQPELTDGSMYLLDEISEFPDTFDSLQWPGWIDDAIERYEDLIEEYFIGTCDIKAWEIMYEHGFCPEGMVDDYLDEESYSLQTRPMYSEGAGTYGDTGPTGSAKKNHFEGMGRDINARLGKLKMKMNPAKNLAKDAIKDAVHDALVDSIGTAISSTGRELISGVPDVMKAMDDRKQERLLNDPHYQLKHRLAQIKKEKEKQLKYDRQNQKAIKLQDKLRKKGLLPAELDPTKKLKLSRSNRGVAQESITNWLPDSFVEEAKYPEPTGALARILAKSLTTGVEKAGSTFGKGVGDYSGELATNKTSREDLVARIKAKRNKRLSESDLSEEAIEAPKATTGGSVMRAILDKAIKDAISGAITSGITTAAEIGAENIGTAIVARERKNLERNKKDPLYQYKLTKKLALKAQKEAESEKRFLDKQAAKLAKLKEKDSKFSEEDVDHFGLADELGTSDYDVDQYELNLGIKIEMEHTRDESLAKELALDHLSEISDYYTRLQQMEEEYKEDSYE